MILEGPKAQPIVHSNSALIRVSNAAWEAPKTRQTQGKKDAKLYVKQNGNKILICSLSRGNPQAMLDLYLLSTDEAAVQLEGEGRLHLSGYYEPKEQEQMERVLESKTSSKVGKSEKPRANGKKSSKNGHTMVETIEEEEEEVLVNEEEKQDLEDLMNLDDDELDQLIEQSGGALGLDEDDLQPEQPNMTRSEKKKTDEAVVGSEEELEALEDMEDLDELQALENELNAEEMAGLEGLDEEDLQELEGLGDDELEGLEDEEEPEAPKKQLVKKKKSVRFAEKTVKKKVQIKKDLKGAKAVVKKSQKPGSKKTKRIKKKVLKKPVIASVQKKFSQGGQKTRIKKKKFKNRKKQA